MSALAQVIGAIGRPEFVATSARSLCAMAGFDLAAVIVHRGDAPVLLHEDFGRIGGRAGIDTYLRVTHRINPMLGAHRSGIFRAADHAVDTRRIATMAPHIEPAADEELGFRTVGWPARLEEVALHFGGCGGTVEFGLYRERGRRGVDRRTLAALDAMRAPLAAAFERHHALSRPVRLSALSPREEQVCSLLLAGCSTEAIALRLEISAHTVKDYRKAIFRKLGICSLAELFAALN